MSASNNITSVQICSSDGPRIDVLRSMTNYPFDIYGSCEQDGTPTPSNPVSIVCNNGTIKARHQSGLPLGYTLLAYIESTGTQAILTDYMPLGDDTIEVDYTLTSLSQGGDKFIIGSRPSTSAENVDFWVETYGAANSWYVRYGSEASVSAAFQSGDNTGTFSLTKNLFKINGTTRLTPSYNGDPVYPMSIFARRNRDNTVWAGAYVQISNVRVYGSNNALKHNYVPVKRSDNVIGMYDLVFEQFFTNQGTGDFTAGSTVNDPIEIYTDGTQEVITDALQPQPGSYTVPDNLLGVDTYKDNLSILYDSIYHNRYKRTLNKNTDIKILDGSESWTMTDLGAFVGKMFITDKPSNAKASYSVVSTIAPYGCTENNYGQYEYGCFTDSTNHLYVKTSTDFDTVEEWKAYLTSMYNSNTPVIMVYALDTAVQTIDYIPDFTLKFLPFTIESSLSTPTINYSHQNVSAESVYISDTYGYAGVYRNNQTVQNVNLNRVTCYNNSLYNAFYNCRSLQRVSSINNSITNMANCFYSCIMLTDVSSLPNSVVNTQYCFYSCSRLVNAPTMPNSVVNMAFTFAHCTNLVNVPAIPNSVTALDNTFDSCTSLVVPPSIPNSVIVMSSTFHNCTNLVNAPVIPDSVNYMTNTFRNCHNLAGNIYVHSSNVVSATNCFYSNQASFLTKYVHVPANSTTYNSFIAAGYDEQGTKHGVYIVPDL